MTLRLGSSLLCCYIFASLPDDVIGIYHASLELLKLKRYSGHFKPQGYVRILKFQ